MKQIAIVLALCVGAWYFFVGGRKLDEAAIRAYYDKQAQAFIAGDADTLCRQISKKAVLTGEGVMMGESRSATLNKEDQCEALHRLFEAFDEVQHATGERISLQYDYRIESVEISTDRKRATVTGSSTISMAGSARSIKSTGTAEYVSELGQVRLIKLDSRSVMRDGRMSQSDFFRK